MKRKLLIAFLALATLFTLSVAPINAAAIFESGDTVSLTAKLLDDIYVAGGEISIQGVVNGDMIGAGGSMIIEKDVLNDINAAGGNIIINGNVSDDVRLAGGNIEVNGRVGDDLIVAGGKVVIGPNAIIRGNVHVGAGELIVKGRVNGRIDGKVGSLDIQGRVDKDVEVSIEQNLKISDQGFIRGNLNYSSWKPIGVPKERIGGELVYSKIFSEKNPQQYMRNQVQKRIFIVLAFLILGIVLMKLAPKYSKNVVETYKPYFWKNLLVGIIWLILAPIVTTILLVTVIGIPLAIVILATYLIIAIAAYTLAALWIGSIIYKPKRSTAWNKLGQLLLGLIGISLLCYVPAVGWLIILILFVTGTGAMLNVARERVPKKKLAKKKKK
jgi:hypothetical protein